MRSPDASESAGSPSLRPLVAWTLWAGVSMLLAAGCGSPEPADPATLLRVPVGLKRWTHQSFDAVELSTTSAGRAAFDLRADAGAIVEFGVLRALDLQRKQWRWVRRIAPPRPRSYQVRFWRQTWRGPRLLLEETVELAVNEPATFRLDGEMLDAARKPARILCEVEALDDGGEAGGAGTGDGGSASAGDAAGGEAGALDGIDPPRERLACLAPAVWQRRQAREWNVLMVSFDTLRADHLGAYGYPLDTSPNFDRFAAQGVLFTQAISPAPWTTPAHYSLFTGLNPSAHRNHRSAAEPFLNDQTLARRLRDHGYYTLGITGGGSISARFGMANGFNAYREYSSYPNTIDPSSTWEHKDDTGRAFRDAGRWLEANAEAKFFLFLQHFECHDPYEGQHFLTGTEEDLLTRRKALYDGDIRHADSYFGRLLYQLRELDLLSNTLIVFLSDHGDEFHDHYLDSDVIPPSKKQPVAEISIVDHAHSLYDELLRVPLVFRVPDLEPPRRLDNQVRLIDVMPTVLDLLGITPGGPVQGESLVPLMRTGKRQRDPPALAESTFFGPVRKAIRMDGYKYIWIPNLEDTTGWTLKGLVEHELFDLVNDPGETTNLYLERPELGDKLHHALLDELKASLDLYQQLQQQRPEAVEQTEVEDDVLDALKALGYIE